MYTLFLILVGLHIRTVDMAMATTDAEKAGT